VTTNIYIIKLYNNIYKILYPKQVPLVDLEYIKLELDRRFAKLPIYTRYLPYLVVKIPPNKYPNVNQSLVESPSIRRTELL
jgi:hypothetical protein